MQRAFSSSGPFHLN